MTAQASRTTAFSVWLVCLLSVPVLYLASVPPIYSALIHFTNWSAGHKVHWANRWIGAYERPYVWLHMHTPLRKTLGAYCHWWAPDIGLP